MLRVAMDEASTQKFETLSEAVGSGINEVDAAIESGEFDRQINAAKMVEELSRRYNELLGSLNLADKDMVERRLGRRVTDLRRAAAGLTRRDSGQKVEKARDAGFIPFIEQRQPPKSIVPPRAPPTDKLSVGSEVDSWCGKCKEMRVHHVVAMVGGEPKQVICVVCNSRHNFRDSPPEKTKKTPGETIYAGGGAKRPSAEDRELQKRQDAKRALQKELSETAEPRPFDPKGRYKAGEIISHPEHGRGKIENVLRSSMLVRFLDGLRPLDLQ
jgi:RNase P/RNase MRP subunit POP5